MSDFLRVLIVEDSILDAELTLYELNRCGFLTYSERVETCGSMRKALKNNKWDIILSDNTMPQFSAIEALRIRNELTPEVPFFIISGSLDDELIAEAQKSNCHSFFIKGQLKQLGKAISDLR